MNTRAKIRCTSINKDTTTENVAFMAVYSEDPNNENKWFSDATPALYLNIVISNPAAQGSFVIGKEYYLDFSPAN